MALALAAFATSFPAVADYAGPAPPAAAPGELHLAPEHPLTPPVARRVALQPLFGPAPLSGAGEALVGGWMRLEDPRPADAATVAFYTDAWLPSPWPRLSEPAPAPTVDLTIHFRTRLPLAGADAGAPVLARFHSTTAHDGFFEEDGEVWSVDGTLLAQSRQLGILRPR
jgi:acyl-CoA thioesterase